MTAEKVLLEQLRNAFKDEAALDYPVEGTRLTRMQKRISKAKLVVSMVDRIESALSQSSAVGAGAREAALEAAALDFIAKVDRGEARSKKSYAAFRAALQSEPVGLTPAQLGMDQSEFNREMEIARQLNALQSEPVQPAGKGEQEPVAWRWRPRGATVWIYNPEAQWLAEHRDEIESEPLYALPSSPVRRTTQPIQRDSTALNPITQQGGEK